MSKSMQPVDSGVGNVDISLTTNDPQLSAALSFIKGWATLDINAVMEPLTLDGDFRYYFISRDLFDKPREEQDRNANMVLKPPEYRAYASKMMARFERHDPQIEEITCRPGLIILRLRVTGATTTHGAYLNHVLLSLETQPVEPLESDTTGPRNASTYKIRSIREFVDIQRSRTFFVEEKQRAAQTQGKL